MEPPPHGPPLLSAADVGPGLEACCVASPPGGGGQALQVEPTGPSASPPLAIVGAGGMADILSQLERRAWRGGHVLTPRGALPHTG